MITWAQNVKSAPVGGSAPCCLSVRLSVHLSVTYRTSPKPVNHSGWKFQGTIGQGQCTHTHISEIGPIGWDSAELRAKNCQKPGKKRDWGAKILTQIFCIYFAFQAILSNFRKIVKKKNFFLKNFFEIFFWKFFESCLELHETQSKSKKYGSKFFTSCRDPRSWDLTKVNQKNLGQNFLPHVGSLSHGTLPNFRMLSFSFLRRGCGTWY